MFDTFGFEDVTARQVSVFFALALGVVFGALAERTGFCFRRALVGSDRRSAMGIWATALAVALLGTQGAVEAGWISFDAHRFMAPTLPLVAILVGGAMFGAGMVLTRGCVSRLTVLTGTGNLRAMLVVIAFAIAAHATLKGILAPLRTGLGGITVDLGDTVSLAALPGGAWVWSTAIAAAAALIAITSGNRALSLLGAALIGLLVPIGWIGTGYVLLDEFDPIAMESLSFTSPMADSLFFTIASSAIPAGFGVGLVGGVMLGALAASVLSGSFAWQSYDSPRQTGRYLAGAVSMGIGGVLAGGCTLGAGLSGIPTLSFAAILALVAIAAGALITNAILNQAAAGSAGSSTKPVLRPAE